MAGFELIVFDCDGVLVDSEIICAEVESALLREAGYPISAAEMGERFAGLTWKDILFAVEREAGVPLQAALIDKSEALLDERLARDVVAITGAAQCIKQLSGPRCICSNSGKARLEMMLAKTGLASLFGEHVYSARDLGDGRTKPAPDVFLHAAGQFGSDPGRCVVIEDSVHGVQGARAAGMRVIGFTGGSHSYPGHADNLIDAGAETAIHRFADLAGTISALGAWAQLA